MKKFFRIIFYDKAGENNTLKENCAKNSDEIKLEFTSPGTPQKNGMAEQGFSTLYYRMSMMMSHMGIHENLKTDIWTNCMAIATKLENTTVNPHKN